MIPIVITILIIASIAITAISKIQKNKITESKEIEHNWQRTGAELYCNHCNKTLKIGEWVEYEPEKTIKTVVISDEETGLEEYKKENEKNTMIKEETSNQEFKQEQQKYWRVIGIQDKDENGTNETLLIKMSSSTTQKLRLYGAKGYNNGPEIMNKICKELYSNSQYGEARSITMEDIENITEYTTNGGFYGIRTNEDDLQIYEFNGRIKDMPIWEDLKKTGTYYTPDGINTEERLGEYELNGHGYEIMELDENIMVMLNPAINNKDDMIEIKANIGKTITNNQYGEKDKYYLATQGIIAEPNIVAFGLGSVNGDSYVRSFCDMYFSTGGKEYVEESICPVVEVRNEIPKVISLPK